MKVGNVEKCVLQCEQAMFLLIHRNWTHSNVGGQTAVNKIFSILHLMFSHKKSVPLANELGMDMSEYAALVDIMLKWYNHYINNLVMLQIREMRIIIKVS